MNYESEEDYDWCMAQQSYDEMEQAALSDQAEFEDASSYPNEFAPVLALITHIGELGRSEWYEVVYYSNGWHSYSGSKTFEDGEKVLKWRYCKDCF